MLIDNVKLKVTAGNGGNGCVSFRREKYVSHGGPDGGDGGNGGNIVIEIDNGANTLLTYRYKHKFAAKPGDDGKGGKIHGKTAEDLVLKVPPGTIIKDAESGQVIKDMSDCEPYILCKGGRGGWGNQHFATPTRQIPRFAKGGLKGEEREVIFELKMLADVGLIGLPNAGKSSILSVISAATPKIADYRFTTLVPNLGVVNVGEGHGFVVADIPGLIEGASEGVGLGHEFLRHVDRCRLLVHVVDVSGYDGDPIENIKLINEELAKYSEELAKRPQIIAANKLDIHDDEIVDFEEFERFINAAEYELVYVSAATNENIQTLVNMISERLKLLPEIKIYEPEYVKPEESAYASREITVTREDDAYIVEGEWLYNLMNSINIHDRESLRYFQRMLLSNGIIERLEELGVTDGDTVIMYDYEFDFVK